MTRPLLALGLLALVATIAALVKLRRDSQVWSSEPYGPSPTVQYNGYAKRNCAPDLDWLRETGRL